MKVDLIGHVYGRLTVLCEISRPPGIKNNHRHFLCRCECGTEKILQMPALRSGATQSCGCLSREIRSKPYNGKPITKYSGYKSWGAMLDRCLNVRCKDFSQYGGRGIAVCERWRDPVVFAEDMGEKPPGLSIERIDVNGDYEPGNCVWATAKRQGQNKRNNRLITIFGQQMTASAIWQKYGMKESTFYNRLAAGMTPEEAVTKPVRRYSHHQSNPLRRVFY